MICNNCGVIIYVFVMISCDIYLCEASQLPAHCKAFEIFIRTHEACNLIMYQESSSQKRFLFTFIYIRIRSSPNISLELIIFLRNIE